MFKPLSRIITLFLCAFLLSACQSYHTQTHVIATAFNLSTSAQQKILEYGAPKDVREYKNIRYSVHPDLHFDLYQPQQAKADVLGPTIIWIHGGGWISGSKQHARGYFQRLAQAGYNVVSIEYQFSPDQIYPAQLVQINQAMAYLNRYAEHYQIDRQQLFFAGDSAGANLASHYAAFVTHPELAKTQLFQPSLAPQQIRGLILHCGIYDMNAFVNTADQQLKIIEWTVLNLVQAYTGGRKQDDIFLSEISPIRYVHSNYPPVFISSGNKDFLTQTQAYPFVDALKAQNIPVTSAFYPDSKSLLIHEYQFFMWQKESQQSLQKTLDFLNQYRLH